MIVRSSPLAAVLSKQTIAPRLWLRCSQRQSVARYSSLPRGLPPTPTYLRGKGVTIKQVRDNPMGVTINTLAR